MWKRGRIVGARGRNVGSVKRKENLEGGSRMDTRKGGEWKWQMTKVEEKKLERDRERD